MKKKNWMNEWAVTPFDGMTFAEEEGFENFIKSGFLLLLLLLGMFCCYCCYCFFFCFFFFSFDSALVDIPCIVSGIGSILLFFPLTCTLDLLAAALHVHKCTKAHLDFDPQLLSVNVYVHQITFYHWNNPVEIFKGT